jgi:uncharacterized membrane protein YbhN (UPF0104 family)
MKRWLAYGLKFAVSAALIVYVFVRYDLSGAIARMEAPDPALLLLAVAVFLFVMLNNTERWVVVIAAIGGRLGFWAAFRIMFIAIFLNQALPSTIGGDAARMYFARRDGLSLAVAVNGVMLERAVAMIGLILLVVASQPLLLARIGDNPAKYVFPVLAAASAAGVIALMMLDRIPERWRRWTVARGIVRLAADTKRLFLNPGYAASAVILGVSGQVFISLQVFVLALSLRISDIGFLDCLVLVPPVILITIIPISIAGWGVRELTMVYAFGLIGVPDHEAITLSLLFGIFNAVIALPGGVVWLARGARSTFETTAPES